MRFQFPLIILTLFVSQCLSENVPTAAPAGLRCTRPKSSICTLQNVIYKDFRLPTLPNLDDKRTIQIRSGNIPRFSKELSQKFANASTVQLGHLQIQSLWLGPKVKHLSAAGNLIQSLSVDELAKNDDDETIVVEFQMESLNLENNKLSNIRELKNFSSLVDLRLDGNQLEFVEMEIFSNMKKLKKLSLARNRMSKVSAGELIELPTLGWLSFAHNNLTSMGVKNWAMTHLTELYLSHNQLVSLDVENFDQFLSLEKLALAGNSWSCYWLSKALKLIGKRYITLVDHDSTCEAMLMDGVCCAMSMTVSSDDYPSFTDLAERITEFGNAQDMAFSELERKLSEVNQMWTEEWNILNETVSKREDYWKKLTDPNDDNRVTETDLSQLGTLIRELENASNSLQSLGEEHGRFAEHFTRLRYSTMEQKNKLLAQGKPISDLKNTLEKFKESFDANFMST
ncbi:uncharacterized protein LOC128737230 [Sabethes cyaneus]|uniref:uncharacterized protein LOC128737230 n=1 Tax=Sabethes cyaneus TaxID=53552 RepID=UPI00237D85B2|nr:uncharacterized protein LOC128737230 [Sabethes cyaneus]